MRERLTSQRYFSSETGSFYDLVKVYARTSLRRSPLSYLCEGDGKHVAGRRAWVGWGWGGETRYKFGLDLRMLIDIFKKKRRRKKTKDCNKIKDKRH